MLIDSSKKTKGLDFSNSIGLGNLRSRVLRLVAVVAMLGATPILATEERASASAPTWIPGTYWVATSRSGMPNQLPSHGNAVAAYGNGRFVIGGSGSSLTPYLISSTDGATFVSRKKGEWTISQYERTNNVVTITTTTDHLISVGQKFTIQNSTLATDLGTTNGTSAVVTAIPTSTTFTFTLTGSDVAATAGSLVNDNRNNEGASAIVFGGQPGSEVFLMSGAGGANKVWRSADGENWSVIAYHGDNSGRNSNSWTSAAYGAGKFVALTDSSSNRIIYSSDNGTTWLTATLPAGLASSTWSSVTYGGGKFVAVSSTTSAAQVMTSDDGVTWTSQAAAEANQWRSVAYGGGAFMAVAMSGTNRVMTSSDGVTWTAKNVPSFATAQWRAVAWAGTAFVLTGASSAVVATTDAGATWNSMVDAIGGGGPFNNATITAMVWTGTMLLGVPNETGKGIAQSYAPSAPTVSNQTPTSGTSAGGTSVTFSGNWLRSVTSATVDGQAATITARSGGASLATISNNSSSLTITMPPGTSGGQRSILLTGIGGTGTGSFTYNWASPTLTSNVSTAGTALGGDSVTLTGTNLNGATSVTLGTSVSDASENSTNVTSFSVTGTTSIAVTVPARACGQNVSDWYFRVTTPGGTTSGSANFKHTYSSSPTPSITSLGVTSGDISGGDTVVISGTNFRCVTAVAFGSQAASSFTLDSPTQITAVAPAGSAGPVSVSVTGEGGVAVSPTSFTYVTASISPGTQTVSGTAGVAITSSTAFTPTNFTGSVTYAVTSGSLPAGLSLNGSTGVISGTPTAVSSATVTITATGATAGTATATVTFAIVAAPVPTTTTGSSTTNASTSTTIANAPVVPAGASTLVTPTIQAQLEADPGEANAIINGKVVAVETVKTSVDASPAAQLDIANKIVSEIADILPKGADNPLKVVATNEGAEISGLIKNPDDPTEALNVPVEAVTLIKAGDSKVLISALNQTNLPAEVVGQGVLQVTRGGLVAAQAYGLPGSETGEIVLMSTPRLLKSFVVDKNGSYAGQVPLPKDISFGSHTVVMATKNAKVSLGIKLVRTKLQFRIKRTIGTTLFKNRAGVVKSGGGKVSVSATGRCRANSKRVVMAAKPGGCYITVRQAAKGANKAIYYRFTVAVVKKPIKVKLKK